MLARCVHVPPTRSHRRLLKPGGSEISSSQYLLAIPIVVATAAALTKSSEGLCGTGEVIERVVFAIVEIPSFWILGSHKKPSFDIVSTWTGSGVLESDNKQAERSLLQNVGRCKKFCERQLICTYCFIYALDKTRPNQPPDRFQK